MKVSKFLICALFLTIGLGVRGCRCQSDGVQVQPRVLGNFRTFFVRQDGHEVMYIEDYAGLLAGPGCKPPPGSKLAGEPHPFLNAIFRDPWAREKMRELLAASKNTDDFLNRLRQLGYEVEQTTGPRGDGG
jgi:hypothetical protein